MNSKKWSILVAASLLSLGLMGAAAKPVQGLTCGSSVNVPLNGSSAFVSDATGNGQGAVAGASAWADLISQNAGTSHLVQTRATCELWDVPGATYVIVAADATTGGHGDFEYCQFFGGQYDMIISATARMCRP